MPPWPSRWKSSSLAKSKASCSFLAKDSEVNSAASKPDFFGCLCLKLMEMIAYYIYVCMYVYIYISHILSCPLSPLYLLLCIVYCLEINLYIVVVAQRSINSSYMVKKQMWPNTYTKMGLWWIVKGLAGLHKEQCLGKGCNRGFRVKKRVRYGGYLPWISPSNCNVFSYDALQVERFCLVASLY